MKNTIDTLSAVKIIDLAKVEVDCRLIYASEKQILNFKIFGKHHVYCIMSGGVELRRISDQVIISTMHAPYIIGLTLLENGSVFHYLQTSCATEILAVQYNTFIGLLNKHSLWYESFMLCVDFANKLNIRDEACSSRNVYGVIRKHLEIIWELEEEQRLNTSIYNYILSRTSVSRSSLNKVLKSLTSGNYIQMHRGKLINKKKLPLEY